MCKNGICEYQNELDRELEIKRTEEKIRYARLWATEILPELLKGQSLEQILGD